MKVDNSSNQNDIWENKRKLDDKLRSQIKMKEAEIENVKDIYTQRVLDTKNQGEENYIAAIKRNDERLIDATKDYEEKLKDMKENLDRTQKSLSQEEAALRSDQKQKISDDKHQFSRNIEDIHFNANEVQDVIKNQTRNSIQKISDKAKSEKNHMEFKAQAEINSLSNEFNQKETDAERNYQAMMTADIRSHEESMRTQRADLKKLIDENTEKGSRLKEEKLQVQKGEMDYLENHHKDIMAQKNADFKIRYEKLITEHEEILNRLKEQLNTDVKKMVADTETQKRMLATRSEDKFYRIETITPSVVEGEKDITVSLKVPPHEKENVHLSVHGRDLKMTLSRKYNDTLEKEDGSVNKSTRSELFSKEFGVKDLLNPKAISQKYENGILTYKIAKL